CGGPIGEPFDKEAYGKNKAPHGELRATGELFGGQVRIDELAMTRADDPSFRASVDLEKLDLGALMRLTTDPDTKEDAEPSTLEGLLSGALSLDKLKK